MPRTTAKITANRGGVAPMPSVATLTLVAGEASTALEGHAAPRAPARPTYVHGAVKLNPLHVGCSACQIGDEIVKHLTALQGCDVEVVLEIRARVRGGIPDAVERTVSENARQLKFQSFEFEEE